MSTHINAQKGQIASTVLIAGDPLRAKWVADNFLKNVFQYNAVRCMLGYTGEFEGEKISVQGGGMGMPSWGIVVNELAREHSVDRLIRFGSTGAFQPDIKLRDVLFAQGACSDSNMQSRRVNGMHFAPLASFELLQKACEIAKSLMIPFRVGNILATDNFYILEDMNKDEWKRWAQYGVMAAEMESAELYMLAAFFKIQALTILTVSDSLVTGERLSPEDREQSFTEMVQIALKLA